ncbi:hypothetical protein [Bacillus cereus group sp. BfR-BA-01363]|uniref:hypothetical protein n=1 Tax=unclassified Bacillus cereus group TaxID=2750818 RepID=UPI001F579B9D|nr:hypothetical protein [Bacillus cereus group sp. BfR-BA-01363]MDX5853292.1 hypothetical protein [Bacillus cereus group sp. BfR-BA-01363]
MYRVKCYHEKDGVIYLTEYQDVEITEENLEDALHGFVCNWGLDVLEVEENGKVLSAKEVKEKANFIGLSTWIKE